MPRRGISRRTEPPDAARHTRGPLPATTSSLLSMSRASSLSRCLAMASSGVAGGSAEYMFGRDMGSSGRGILGGDSVASE